MSGVNDEPLDHLVGLVNLERLELRQTLVTDAAVDPNWKKLTRLRTLMSETQDVTEAGAKRLSDVLPNARFCDKASLISCVVPKR